MRCFMSVTNSKTKRKTRSASVMAKMMKSGDAVSCHHSFDLCPIIWWIIGMHMAQSIGSSQLRQIALFTPRLVDDRFGNVITVFSWFLIEFDGERLWSDASVTVVCELSVDGVVVVVVVLVLIDVFFNDDFRVPFESLAVDVKIADVSISNSDWIIKTIATSVDELSNKTAAKLELNSLSHSWNCHNWIIVPAWASREIWIFAFLMSSLKPPSQMPSRHPPPPRTKKRLD